MTRKEKLALRQHQSTRQLMGMQGIASHGITTSNSELVFFLIRPDNLSVLSSEGIRARVTALANLLRAEPAVELLVVDSRESFQRNKEFYQKRLEEETTPAIRKLLIEDMRHLDEILSSSASAREFVLILRRDLKADMSEGTLRQLERQQRNWLYSVDLAKWLVSPCAFPPGELPQLRRMLLFMQPPTRTEWSAVISVTSSKA